LKHKKGFTLVELLIVIVVIGILSAMMMLSSTEAVSSAKAAKIVNNLRNLRTAALSWYVDNVDRITDKGRIKNAQHVATGNFNHEGNFAENVDPLEITKYMNGEFTKDGASRGGYSYGGTPVKDGAGLSYFLDHLDMEDGKLKWLIGCYFGNDAKVREKLEARAATANLVQKHTGPNYISRYGTDGGDSTDGKIVYIEVLDFTK